MAEFEVNKGKIVRNTIVLFARMAVTMVIAFFTARFTLSILGSEDYGLNNLISSIVMMLAFLNNSMGTAVQRYYSYEIGQGGVPERMKRVFGTSLFLHICVAVVTLLIAEFFAVFFLDKLNIPLERMHAAHVVFQAAIVGLVFNILVVPYAALLRAREEFGRLSYMEIMQSVLKFALLFTLAYIDSDHLIAYSLLYLGVAIIYNVGVALLARPFEETRTWIIVDRDLIRGMLKFISFLVFTVLAEMLSTKGITVLLNLFFGLVVNAAYAIAEQVSYIVSSFVLNFKQALVPQIMSSYGAGDLRTMNRLVVSGTKITFLLVAIVSFPIIFEADYLLTLWLKTPPEHATKFVVLSIINITITSFTYFLYQGVHASGRVKEQQVWTSVLYLLGLGAIYLALKSGKSYYWAMYITFVVSGLQCLLSAIYAKKYFDFDLREFCVLLFGKCIPLVGILVASLWLITTIILPSFGRVIVTTGVSTALILGYGYVLMLDDSEKAKIVTLVKSKLHIK